MRKEVVLVTGCSSGLGFATAVKLANSGYIVYAGMRSLKNKEKLEGKVNNKDCIRVMRLDLIDESSIDCFLQEILREEGTVDILINNAARALIGPIDSSSIQEIKQLFEVNVFGTLNISQKVINIMRKANKGHILTVSSISGIESCAYLGAYASTKFALEAIIGCWATTLSKWNIRITSLQPGAMNTDLPETISVSSYYKDSLEDPYKNFNIKAKEFLKICLKDLGKQPEEVADQILEILIDLEPKFRYQTCEFSRNLISKHLKDPDGMQWIKEHKEFIKDWL